MKLTDIHLTPTISKIKITNFIGLYISPVDQTNSKSDLELIRFTLKDISLDSFRLIAKFMTERSEGDFVFIPVRTQIRGIVKDYSFKAFEELIWGDYFSKLKRPIAQDLIRLDECDSVRTLQQEIISLQDSTIRIQDERLSIKDKIIVEKDSIQIPALKSDIKAADGQIDLRDKKIRRLTVWGTVKWGLAGLAAYVGYQLGKGSN